MPKLIYKISKKRDKKYLIKINDKNLSLEIDVSNL